MDCRKYFLIVDELKVVNEDDEGCRAFRERFEDRGRRDLVPCLIPSLLAGFAGRVFARALDGVGDFDQAREEAPDVVVRLVDGETTHSPPVGGKALEQLEHQGGLAPSRRSVDQRQLRREGAAVPLLKPAPGDR